MIYYNKSRFGKKILLLTFMPKKVEIKENVYFF